MTSVGVRELKAKLSAYLRKVEAGEALEVTDRGRAIAEIVPAGWLAAQPVPPAWAEMIRSGEVRPPTRPGPFVLKPLPGKFPEGLAKQLLDEGRGEK
ncbi:MAG: type II toxin-antitoxin system prevent-host-death family antitoxin [Acidobacteria bacterium]|nr:MAG: type II toxin-antitoxin system prevent-host-death family antitoxin [Acidobacteriota bacterium]